MGRSACPRLEDRSCLLTRGDWVVEDRVGPDREALSECGLPRRVRGSWSPGWAWSGVARPVPAVADLAGTTTLTAELSAALDGVRGPRPRHDPGRVLVDLAVAIADGAEAISDIAVLADQPALFGSVASDSTCWRLLDALGDPELAAVAAARARAWEVAWAQRAETTGAAFGPSRVAGTAGVEALVIDLDGHIVVCHSEKEQAAPTFKHTFGLLTELPELSSQFRERVGSGAVTVLDHDRARRSSSGYGKPCHPVGWFPSGHGWSVGSVSAGRSVG